MTVELRPLGVRCNIACQYCYQNPQRDAGNLGRSYDLEAMKAAIVRQGGPFVLFGGEPLLLPVEDLEHLWAWGLERFGHNTVQTNGTLIREEHIRLFRTYRVQVGISIDGPGYLNDARWAGTLERTREATAATEAAIERLCREGLPPSLIITLHRGNASAERLPQLHEWLRRLDSLGVASARLHVLEVDDTRVGHKYALSAGENVDALLAMARLESQLGQLRFDVFADMERLMLAEDEGVACVWMACDPYTTEAVRGVEGTGTTSNCGRTNKDGIGFTKGDVPGYERYLALYATPQEYGGCRGCRFFLVCKGQCPGTAIDGDWRNRTEHCEVWKELFGDVERRLLERGRMPLSLHPQRTAVESAMLGAWAGGTNPRLHSMLSAIATRRDAS
jgi:uncharacterized protein